MRKRKIEKVESKDDLDVESETKDKLRRVTECHVPEDDDENIFVSTTPKKSRSRKTKTEKKSQRRKSGTVECSTRKEEVENIVAKICMSLKPEEYNVETISSENHYQNKCEVNDSLMEESSEWNISENDESKTDHEMQENLKENVEDIDEASESSISLENLTNEINENVKKKGINFYKFLEKSSTLTQSFSYIFFLIEKCKAQWNNLFKGGTNSGIKNSPKVNNKKRHSMFSSAKEIKVCPSFKKMPGRCNFLLLFDRKNENE